MKRLRGPAAALAVAGLLAATACGGKPAAAGAAAKTTADREKAGLDFARCMREHGVDVPDPSSDGGFLRIGPGPGPGSGETAASAGPGTLTGPPPGFEDADQACRHFLEDVVGEGGGPIDPKEQDRALKFAQCMRDHGVDMADPDFSNGGIRITVGGPGQGPGSETLDAAQKACSGLFGPVGGGARAGTATASRP